jgi:hypothetical protein
MQGKGVTACLAAWVLLFTYYYFYTLCCFALPQGPALQRADAIIYCTGYRYKFPFLEQHPDMAQLSGQQHVPGGTAAV